MKYKLTVLFLFLFVCSQKIWAVDGTITASAYTVAVGPHPALGSTTITWSWSSSPSVSLSGNLQVWVSSNGAAEQLFSSTWNGGSQVANWIGLGNNYVFRLYSGNNSPNNYLTSLTILGIPTIDASMYVVPAPISGSGTVKIYWNQSTSVYAQVWVSSDGAPEQLVSSGGLTGSATVSWIGSGSKYVFNLYEASGFSASNKGKFIGTVTVRGVPHINPSIGFNKFDLFQQYLGITSGCDLNASSDYKNLLRQMANKTLTDMNYMGTNYVRVAVTGYGATELDLWKNNSTVFWSAMDQMFSDLNAHNIKIIPSFLWNIDQFCQYTSTSRVDFMQRTNTGAWVSASSFITDFLNRYKNNPAILFYEIGNEFNLLANGDKSDHANYFTLNDLQIFQLRVAQLIRSIDANHMITSGAALPRVSESDGLAVIQNAINQIHVGLDIVSIHVYNQDNPANNPFGAGIVSLAKTGSDNIGKTLFIGEVGDTKPYSKANPVCQYTQNVLDIVQQRNIQFSAPWILDFYQFNPYQVDNFDIDLIYTTPLINKIKQVNAALGNTVPAIPNPDITPPQGIITWPVNNSQICSKQLVNVMASDNSCTLKQVDFYFNGIYQTTVSSFPYQFNLNTGTTPFGNYTISAITSDNSGNKSTSVVTVSLGCTPPSRVSSELIDSTNSGLVMYPNPCTDHVAVLFSAEEENKPVYIKILSVNSEVVINEVKETEKGENEINIDVHNLTQGMYMVLVNTNEKSYTRKLIIEK